MKARIVHIPKSMISDIKLLFAMHRNQYLTVSERNGSQEYDHLKPVPIPIATEQSFQNFIASLLTYTSNFQMGISLRNIYLWPLR